MTQFEKFQELVKNKPEQWQQEIIANIESAVKEWELDVEMLIAYSDIVHEMPVGIEDLIDREILKRWASYE